MKMHRIAVSAFMGLVALVSASNVSAADVIDQNSDRNNTFFESFSGGSLVFAQSFQQAASNISGAGIFLDEYTGSSGTVDISLWTDLPNVSAATQIAFGSASGIAGNWVDVFWSSPVSIAADTTYFLVFSSNSDLGLAGDSYNDLASYQRGEMYFSDALLNPYSTAPNGSSDLMFRTYAYQNTAPIPEPETYAMMLAGLGLLALARRRKQKAA
jgi:hypothetical protein